MAANKINQIPEHRRESFLARLNELRDYYGMSWTAIARTLFREFEVPMTHPSVQRIYARQSR